MPFKVPNGVRQVTIELDKPIPSYVSFGKHGRQQVLYPGQTRTCSVCDSPSHERAACPNKRQPGGWRKLPLPPPLEGMVSLGKGPAGRSAGSQAPAVVGQPADVTSESSSGSTPAAVNNTQSLASQTGPPAGGAGSTPGPTQTHRPSGPGLTQLTAAHNTSTGPSGAGSTLSASPKTRSLPGFDPEAGGHSALSSTRGTETVTASPHPLPPVSESWAEEADRARTCTQLAGLFQDGPPGDTMEVQEDTYKRMGEALEETHTGHKKHKNTSSSRHATS
jgi:hypothetical protein